MTGLTYRWKLALGATFATTTLMVSAAYADQPSVRGTLSLSDGAAVQSFPVIISGETVEGEEYKSFVTSDEDGNFAVMRLPPGEYVARPAGQPEQARDFRIQRSRWFFPDPSTVDLGEFRVMPGETLRSD